MSHQLYYRNLPFGIWSTNSTLIVNKDKFEDISDAGILVENDPGIIRSLTQTGLGQNANNPTFLNCYAGIRAINTNVRLKQNVMHKVSRGISLTGGIHKSADITENIIRAQQFGISVNGWVTMTRFRIFDNEIYIDGETIEGSAIFTELLNGNLLGRTTISDNYIELKNARYGIWMNSSDKTGVNRNNISLKNTRPYDGIRLAGSSGNTLFCNLVTGTDVVNEQAGLTLDQCSLNTLSCNTTDDIRRGIWALGPCNPTTLRGNTFKTHFYGLQVGAPGLSGVTGVQVHRGNRWLETYTGGAAGAAHFGSGDEVVFSQLLVDPSDGGELISSEYTSSGASLFLPQSGNTYFCASEPAGCPPMAEVFTDEISETDLAIAKGHLIPGVFVDAQTWTSKRQLYRRLLSDPSLVQQSSSIDDFFYAEANTTVGRFEQLRKDMEALYILAPGTEGQMAENLDSIAAKLLNLQAVEIQLDSDPSPQQAEILITQRHELQKEVNNLQDAQTELDMMEIAARTQAAGLLLTDNAAIQVDAVYEQNQQSVNQVMLENIVAGQHELTQAQLAILRPIANQCPYSGGDAVFQARAMLADGSHYDNSQLCSNGGQALVKPEKAGSLIFNTRPNPSNGYVIAELAKPADEAGEVVLSNALGIRFLMQKYQPGDQVIFLFLDEMPAGIYYLTVRNATYSSTRIIINLK